MLDNDDKKAYMKCAGCLSYHEIGYVCPSLFNYGRKFCVVEAENLHDLSDRLNDKKEAEVKHVQILMIPTPLGQPKPVFQALITCKEEYEIK